MAWPRPFELLFRSSGTPPPRLGLCVAFPRSVLSSRVGRRGLMALSTPDLAPTSPACFALLAIPDTGCRYTSFPFSHIAGSQGVGRTIVFLALLGLSCASDPSFLPSP